MKTVRSVLADTWRGLLQRRLWPVAALLLVALPAVPLLLASEPAPQPVPARDEVAGDSAELAVQPIVSPASGSAREDVRRVLGKRKDPFRPSNQPRRTGGDARAAGGGGKAGADPAPGASPTSGASDAGGAPSSGAGSSTTAPLPAPAPEPATRDEAKPQRQSVTVRWGSSEADELEAMTVRRLGGLPSADTPVVIHLGLTDRGRTAVFLVEAGATAFGDGRCRPDPGNCQTLELRRGETEFLDVAGDDGSVKQYQLDLVRIHRGGTAKASAADVARGRPARAAARSLADGALGLSYDERSGLLERVDSSARTPAEESSTASP